MVARRAEGRMQDKKATALRAQAKVIVTELVDKKVLDPANLWTDDKPRIPEVARALTDYGAHFGVAPVDVEIPPVKKLLHAHVSLLFTRIFFI